MLRTIINTWWPFSEEPPVRNEYDEKLAAWRWWYRNIYLVSPHWLRTRDYIKDVRGWKCERCGCADRRVLNVHHTDPAYSWIGFEHLVPALMRVYCSDCHADHHNGVFDEVPALPVEAYGTSSMDITVPGRWDKLQPILGNK